MADAPCDISGKCEVSDEDERSGAQEAMCIHCGGWRHRNYPRAGNWGTWDGSGDRPRATPPADVIAAMEKALRGVEMWDAARGYPVPYRVRDPLRAALADLDKWRVGE